MPELPSSSAAGYSAGNRPLINIHQASFALLFIDGTAGGGSQHARARHELQR
jgi:hypothetical protein